MNLSKSTYTDWHLISFRQHEVLPLDHVIVGYTSNFIELIVRNAVRKFILDVSAEYGLPLPIGIESSDEKCIEDTDYDSIVALPSRYTKRSLH